MSASRSDRTRLPGRALAGVAALCLGACAAPSTDPREGGFVGGVHGLSSGAYEERVREREESLQRLRDAQQELQREQERLEVERAARAREVDLQRRRLDELAAETAALERDVSRYQAREAEASAEQSRLRSELQGLEGRIRRLSERAGPDADVQALEAERAALEREYRLLLDVYRNLGR
jgi:chromosome segregation ATPase